MRPLYFALLAAVLAVLAIPACTSKSAPSPGTLPGGGTSSSGGSSVEDSGGATVPSQCTTLATAFCKIEAQCDTVDMQIDFAGDQATCVARTLYSCPSESEPGAGNTPSTIGSCATAVGAIADCNAYWSYLVGNNFQLCAPVLGTLADGTSCNDDSQCKGGFCGQSDEGGSCGACAEKPGTTDCQENSNCPTGQLCNASGLCFAAGAVGATCDSNDPTQANQPCAPNFYCKGASAAPEDGGAAVTSGTCAALAAAGDACDSTDADPECGDGLTCASNDQCVEIQFVGAEAACDGILVVCAGGECLSTGAVDAAASACQAYAADGAKCASDGDCEFNSVCTGDICTPSFTTCEVE